MPPALRAWHSSPQIHVFLENLHQDVPTRVTLIELYRRTSLGLSARIVILPSAPTFKWVNRVTARVERACGSGHPQYAL